MDEPHQDHSFDVGRDAYDVLRVVGGEIEAMFLRGMRAASPENLKRLTHASEQLQRMGAEHLASEVSQVVAAIQSNSASGAALLLRTQTTLRVFERVMSLRAAESSLALAIEDAREATPSDGA